ncbi:MAG: hypothetical protein HEP71_18555 [Roseivirga sp.]|nr:hypothetical protein [Roseivirga sp.]
MKRIAIHTVDFRALGALIWILAGLTLIATLTGVFRNDFYQDDEWVRAQWLGQDVVTLIFGIPLLLLAAKKAIVNRSLVWELVLAGTLLYFSYIYTFYVFEANFTFLYFFHLPIFSLSLLCFFIVCHHILNARNDYAFTDKMSRFTIVFYLLLISAMLSWLWLQDLINHLVMEEFLSQTPDGQPPLVIYSLDLGILIPLAVIACLLLLRNHALGLILIGIVLTKTFLLGFALMAMSLSMYRLGLDHDIFLITLWSFIGLAGLLLSIVYLNKLKVYPRPELR